MSKAYICIYQYYDNFEEDRFIYLSKSKAERRCKYLIRKYIKEGQELYHDKTVTRMLKDYAKGWDVKECILK